MVDCGCVCKMNILGGDLKGDGDGLENGWIDDVA